MQAAKIGRRIAEAVNRMAESDAEAALIQVSIAVDATAKKEYPNKRRGDAFKEFIRDNLALITKVTFGTVTITENLRIKYDHPQIKSDPDGLCSIEQILWHVVRGELIHEAGLSPKLKLTNERILRRETDAVVLPTSLVFGLISAVVVSPKNKNDSIPLRYRFRLGEQTVPLNELWGQKSRLLRLLEAASEIGGK